MSTHYADDDYSQFTASQLREAAQRVSTDLARSQEMAGDGGLRPESVARAQDLQKWMRNEAARRDS